MLYTVTCYSLLLDKTMAVVLWHTTLSPGQYCLTVVYSVSGQGININSTYNLYSKDTHITPEDTAILFIIIYLFIFVTEYSLHLSLSFCQQLTSIPTRFEEHFIK